MDESGLVVFVCALILLAIILGPVKNIWQNDTYRQTLIDCPYCEGEVPRTAIKCMHCGSELKNYVTYSTPVKTPNVNKRNPGVKKTKIFCSRCKSPIAIYSNQKSIDCWNCKTTNLV